MMQHRMQPSTSGCQSRTPSCTHACASQVDGSNRHTDQEMLAHGARCTTDPCSQQKTAGCLNTLLLRCRCVNLGTYESQKVVTFVPPDGEFELMR
jgi:hypothetical protein